MIRALDWFARVSTKAPAFTLLTLLSVTIGLGAAATQLEVDASMDGFAPDGGVADTLSEVDDRFGTSTSVQVLVDAGEGGNVIDAETLADMDVLVDRLESHPDITPALVDELAGQPAVVSFAFPFDQAAQSLDSSLGELDAQMVDTVATELFDNGDEQITGMFSNDLVTDPPQARSGLVIVNLDADESMSVRSEASRAIQDVVDATDVGETRRSVMSMAAVEDGVMESLSRDTPILLAASLFLVVLVLVLLFRTFIDVLVGLTGLVVSIVWMVGIAALLGPGVLDVVGPFNQISIAVPVLLVGLGIDYSVHLTTRYREQRARGDSPTRSARVAATTVGVALVLATIASVAGFLANLVTPLPPIRDFGIFAAIGIVTAFIVLSAAVPAARTLVDRRAERRADRTSAFPAMEQSAAKSSVPPAISPNGSHQDTNDPTSDTATGDSQTPGWVRALTFLATRLPVPVIAIAAVLMIIGGTAATGLSTEFDERDFLPEGEPVLRTIDRMDEQFGGEVGEQTFIMIEGGVSDPELLAAVADIHDNLAGVDQVRTNGTDAEVQSFLMTRDQVVISGESVRERIASDIESWHDPEAAAAEVELPNPLDIEAFTDDLDGELDLPDEVVDALDARLPSERAAAVALASTMDPEELEDQIRDQLVEDFADERPDTLTDDALQQLAQLEESELTMHALADAGYPLTELSDDDHDMLDRLDAIEAAGDVAATDGHVLAAHLAVLQEMMPDDLASVVDDDGLLVTVSTTAGYLGAGGLVDDLEVALAPAHDAGAEIVVASDPLLNAEIIDELADAQLMAIVISLVAAALLLVIATLVSSRSVALGLIGIVPSVVALALVLGSMRLLGMPFNALTATVASIAVGIGVPYGIHLTNRFNEAIRIGLNAEESALDTLNNTGAALVGSALTTGLAFGVLMLSSSTPLQQFGTVSTLMIGLAAAGCLLVQPAMLVLWGRHRIKKTRRLDAPDQASEMIAVPEGTRS